MRQRWAEACSNSLSPWRRLGYAPDPRRRADFILQGNPPAAYPVVHAGRASLSQVQHTLAIQPPPAGLKHFTDSNKFSPAPNGRTANTPKA